MATHVAEEPTQPSVAERLDQKRKSSLRPCLLEAEENELFRQLVEKNPSQENAIKTLFVTAKANLIPIPADFIVVDNPRPVPGVFRDELIKEMEVCLDNNLVHPLRRPMIRFPKHLLKQNWTPFLGFETFQHIGLKHLCRLS